MNTLDNQPSGQPRRQAAPVNLRELAIRARALAGHCVAEVAAALNLPIPQEARRAKGFIGQVVERALGADPQASDGPDFPDLGVELKTVPVDRRGLPVESTFCCSIHMSSADRACWETCRLRRRLSHVLWVPVEAAKIAPLPQRRLGQPFFWQPTAACLSVLRSDWEELMGMIGAGCSADLTAHRGQILQVRPKASDARQVTLGLGPDGPERLRPLGFYLRAQFTAQLIRAQRDIENNKL